MRKRENSNNSRQEQTWWIWARDKENKFWNIERKEYRNTPDYVLSSFLFYHSASTTVGYWSPHLWKSLMVCTFSFFVCKGNTLKLFPDLFLSSKIVLFSSGCFIFQSRSCFWTEKSNILGVSEPHTIPIFLNKLSWTNILECPCCIVAQGHMSHSTKRKL